MRYVQTASGASSRWTRTVFSPLLLTVLSEPWAECAQPREELVAQGPRLLLSVTLPLVLAFTFCLTGILIGLGGNR